MLFYCGHLSQRAADFGGKMNIFDILELIFGLALFLFGMSLMGDALKRSAGNKLKVILGKLTSNVFKGFLLGLVVTAIIQSSSATTVMVVGFVSSGTMTLTQAVGVIMGANLGTAATAWLISLSEIGASGESVSSFMEIFKTTTWVPIIALIGICLLMTAKSSRKKDVAAVLLGFAVLMVGIEYMSGSVAGLKDSESFRSIMTMFENPILGLLAGLLVTAIVQSSSASVGILQSLTVSGTITYGMAIPIVMGQNIGTCVTALISSAGATRDGKRAAFIHLYFNIIGVAILLPAYYLVNGVASLGISDRTIDMVGVAVVHTAFKILSILIMSPFTKQLEKLACVTVKGKNDEEFNMLDERLLATPAIAIERANEVAAKMAQISVDAMRMSIKLFDSYDKKTAQLVRDYEDKADKYEDMLGSYLIKLSSRSMSESESHSVTKLLHILGDFERISDHAVNVVESAEEMLDKQIEFSDEAKAELKTLCSAVLEILDLAEKSFIENDISAANTVEPLEQVVDYLRDEIKRRHIKRLQNSVCSIEHGFVLSDILTNLERVADHCSNIAGCVIEISQHDALDMHEYLKEVKKDGAGFKRMYANYMKKYSLKAEK